MGIILRVMIGYAADASVHFCPTQFFGADLLTGCRLQQRWPSQKDRALFLDNDCFVGHGRHIGATGGATSHHNRYLGDAFGRHIGLVIKNATEVFFIWKDFVLKSEIGATGVHQVDTRQ